MLPEEIVIDILSRLPVRSLLQFRRVSKSWHSLISSPEFAQTHLRKSLLSPALCKNRERVLVNHFPLQSIKYYNSPEPPPITDLHHPLLNPGTRFSILGSCNGLVCLLMDFGESVMLYNPATRLHRSIAVLSSPPPNLPDAENDSWGFFFDSNSNECKVVGYLWARPPRGEYWIQVFRLGASSDQATVCRQVFCPYYIAKQHGVFLNGSIHFLMDHCHNRNEFILCFDLAREVFYEIPVPGGAYHPGLGVYHLGLTLLEGCLSVLDHDSDHHKVWVMKEYDILDCIVRPSSLYQTRPPPFLLEGGNF